jgi:hypothetical protein
MAISVTHSHVSEVADDPGFDVSSGEWNAAHIITGAAEAYQATSFPGSPTEGLLCYRTDRHVLYQYTGSVWAPIVSHAAMTLYVDPTGTDDSAHGWASGTDAYATINYALSQVPPLYGGNVTINIAAGTYTENVVARGKRPTGDYTITLQGAMTTQVTDTMTSGSTPTAQGSTQGSVTKSGAGWTTDAFKRMLCKFTSGSNDGTYRVIESNTSETLTLIGGVLPAAPQNGNSFLILSHTSIISGTFSAYCPVLLADVSITGSTGVFDGPCGFTRCKLGTIRSSGLANFVDNHGLDLCTAESTAGHTTVDVADVAGSLTLVGTYITMSSSGIALLIRQGAKVVSASCVFQGDGGGAPNGIILCRGFHETTAGNEMKTLLKNTTGTGIAATWGGHFYQRSLCAVVNVTTEYSAEAASYSYVAP